MYASFHSAVGVAIMLSPLPLEVKIPLAIMSHVPGDMLGEGWMGTNWLKKEIVLHGVLLVVAIATGMLIPVILGIMLGNLIDVVDKVVLKEVLGTDDLIHSSRWYPNVVITLSGETTFILNCIAMASVFLMLVIKV